MDELIANNSYPDDVVIHKLDDYEKLNELIMVFKHNLQEDFLHSIVAPKKRIKR